MERQESGDSERQQLSASSDDRLRAEVLLAAKAVVARVGGADAARRAIEVLGQLS